MFQRLRETLRSYGLLTKRSRNYCAVCREYLPPHGGGIEVANLERVCSERCADEHHSNNVW